MYYIYLIKCNSKLIFFNFTFPKKTHMNLTSHLQQQNNKPLILLESNQLSPISRKNIFSKSKKKGIWQKQDFNPHLQTLSTNYYVKDNQVIPYSYTVTETLSFQRNLESPTNQILKANKAKNFGSKMLSLKQFSCIQTVSQKSCKENESDSNSQLQISRTFKPKQIYSQISSPFDLKNFQSTFTVAHCQSLNKSDYKPMKSYGIQHTGKNSKDKQSISFKMNTIKNEFNKMQNDIKTNRININCKNKNLKNCELQTNVIEIKIKPSKQNQLKIEKNINVQQSNIIFDYNKFHTNKSSYMKQTIVDKEESIFHPINKKIFKFFGQVKENERSLKISNQNETFIDIVKEINSPQNKNSYRSSCITQNNNNNYIVQKQFRKQQLCSKLTCLVQQGPRSLSVGKDTRKLSGQKNNFNHIKRQSIVLKTQTRPTTGRSQYLNQFQMNSPTLISPSKLKQDQLNKYPNTNKINFTPSFVKYDSHLNQIPSKQVHKNIIKTNLSQQKTNKFHIQTVQSILSTERKSNSKDSRRRSSKGISVSSKQKNKTIQISSGNTRPIQNMFGTSKLKSLNQIKNMKKLSLASPKKNMQSNQTGSPIRFIKQ